MKSEGNTAPAASVLSGLKDFQRQTAEYAFERLFNAPDSTRRFLVADEVGLGKTLVAAGVIGLTVEHLQALGTPRVDIIYICSNQAIARQNVNRLKHLLGIEAKPLASRITLLPYRLTALENPVNLIALTAPGTSFGSASAEGVIKERIILYRLLRGAWGEAVRHRRLVFLGGLQSVVQFLLPNSPDMRTVPEGGNGPMTGGIVIPFVQAQVLHAFRARDYNVLQGRSQEFRIMDVGSSHRHAQGPACCVDQDALLAPSFAPVGGVGSNRTPPKRALPMEQSADCHSQSTPPSSSQPSTRAAQMPSSTPHPTQRWKVRWMVLSSPNSLGKWFHWQLLRIRKIMPSSILRWSALLRPLALGGSNSSITGSICSHRSSGTSQIVGVQVSFRTTRDGTGTDGSTQVSLSAFANR